MGLQTSSIRISRSLAELQTPSTRDSELAFSGEPRCCTRTLRFQRHWSRAGAGKPGWLFSQRKLYGARAMAPFTTSGWFRATTSSLTAIIGPPKPRPWSKLWTRTYSEASGFPQDKGGFPKANQFSCALATTEK